MRSFIDISYGKLKNPTQKLDVYLPECESFPVFIYFHGGGIEGGDNCDHFMRIKRTLCYDFINQRVIFNV